MRAILFSLIATFSLLGSAAVAAPVHGGTPVVAVAPAETATYKIDPVHSEMSFRIRHLMGRVAGTFTDWQGTITADPSDFSTLSVDVTVQTASIHTLNEQRDAHLRTPDFFAAEEFPTMTFKSSSIVVNGNSIVVYGDLTLRGTTKPVVLTGRYLGAGPDPWGGQRIAFEATTSINRQDFGVSFNQMVEGVGMIGDEVEISLAVEAVRQ